MNLKDYYTHIEVGELLGIDQGDTDLRRYTLKKIRNRGMVRTANLGTKWVYHREDIDANVLRPQFSAEEIANRKQKLSPPVDADLTVYVPMTTAMGHFSGSPESLYANSHRKADGAIRTVRLNGTRFHLYNLLDVQDWQPSFT